MMTLYCLLPQTNATFFHLAFDLLALLLSLMNQNTFSCIEKRSLSLEKM